MAYDADLTEAMRGALVAMLGRDAGVLSERRMMGSACFMARGNMVAAASRDKEGRRRLMFRVGKGNPAVDDLPGGEPVIMAERLIRGFFYVDADMCDAALRDRWLRIALDHAMSLPEK